jgi:hypothetical protein
MRLRSLIVMENVMPGMAQQEKDCSNIKRGCIDYATDGMVSSYSNVDEMMASHKNHFTFQTR